MGKVKKFAVSVGVEFIVAVEQKGDEEVTTKTLENTLYQRAWAAGEENVRQFLATSRIADPAPFIKAHEIIEPSNTVEDK
jgi:hypothetical protein